MKFRTIKEAKSVVIPDLPPDFFDQFNTISRTVQHGNESSVSKLRKIYSLTDTITAFLTPYMVCKKGCSHCCRIDVAMTTVEAQYIQKNLGIVSNIDHTISSGHTNAKRACTFLEPTGNCSIYENRPYACRTFFTLDNPSFCEEMNSNHITYTSRSNQLLSRMHYWIVHINGNQPIRDIRDFFPTGHSNT